MVKINSAKKAIVGKNLKQVRKQVVYQGEKALQEGGIVCV